MYFQSDLYGRRGHAESGPPIFPGFMQTRSRSMSSYHFFGSLHAAITGICCKDLMSGLLKSKKCLSICFIGKWSSHGCVWFCRSEMPLIFLEISGSLKRSRWYLTTPKALLNNTRPYPPHAGRRRHRARRVCGVAADDRRVSKDCVEKIIQPIVCSLWGE